MTSSNGLVDALARDQVNDNPVLLWLSLIGNDVCNGHEGFDHMTTPDNFYNAAMESLNKLDTMLPANSYVVSLALFDGELLYDTMHAQQHPIGTKYSTLYDYLNCMTVSPCWGWLNSNGTDRRITTHISNELNRVYTNISKTATFKNFEYIYYAPAWVELFTEFESADVGPMSNLIEAVDGFHPSQAGNALFAKRFWDWFLTNHPDALGPVNPYNDEIDKMFFSN
jgi:acyloxyacyl hydrolase